MSYDKYKRHNRKVKPTQNNPYSNLIRSYMRGSNVSLPLNLQTQGDPFLGPREQQSLLSEMEHWKNRMEHWQGVNEQYYNEAKLYYERAQQRYSERVQTLPVDNRTVTSYGSGITEYDSEHGYETDEDVPEFKPSKEGRGKYPTYNFRDYDVYMAYYRTMGFYIPNAWKIDYDMTSQMWKQFPNTWKWRKIMLYYTGQELYQELQYIPKQIGFVIRATDYINNEKRGWFMLPTLAFRNTVDNNLLRNMEQALERKPYKDEEHFRVEKQGFSYHVDDTPLDFIKRTPIGFWTNKYVDYELRRIGKYQKEYRKKHKWRWIDY